MAFDKEKYTISEIRNLPVEQLKEVEIDLRKAIVTARMDIYNKDQIAKEKRILKIKRALARVLTVQNHINSSVAN
jgi:ribosomal protein L29